MQIFLSKNVLSNTKTKFEKHKELTTTHDNQKTKTNHLWYIYFINFLHYFGKGKLKAILVVCPHQVDILRITIVHG
jgi:hypothetical protein